MKLVHPISPRQLLHDQPWLRQFLLGKGFAESSPNVFSNGRASLRFEGTRLSADPGNGGKAWIADLNEAEPETIRLLLEQIVRTPPFQSEAENVRQETKRELVVGALQQIMEAIRDHPDTGSGQSLRRFLWSLYNQYHLVNLWQLTASLDAHHAQAAAEVCTGALTGLLREQDLKQALVAAGEMERWDREHPANDAVQRLDEAEDIVRKLVAAVPPSHAHTELVSLLFRFQNAKMAIIRRP